ncbi:MAG: hypothetical protein PHX51_00550 [Clostridia bacterium]|nr:hypothetical protein [Clostridia bacterium]
MAKKTYICPYCLSTHNISDYLFRCSNIKCEATPDVEMTEYLMGDVDNPKLMRTVFEPIKKNKELFAECPFCRQRTYKIVCPDCHNALPAETLAGENIIISVVGARDTGKSHFVGVILKELTNRVFASFGGALEAFDDSAERYERIFGRKLYVELKKLPLTKSSEIDADNGAYRPLVFTLTLPNKGKTTNFTFVFYDTAGEDIKDEDTMNSVAKYIAKSDGVIFLLDPMQIPKVTEKLDPDVVRRASSVGWKNSIRAEDILARVIRVIRADRGIKIGKKLPVPVAVALAKFDTLFDIIPAGNAVAKPSPHCASGGFVAKDAFDVNQEVIAMLSSWEANAICGQIALNFEQYSFFALSALGLDNNPKKDDRIERPRPHRIEDPLLWILAKKGIIPVIK